MIIMPYQFMWITVVTIVSLFGVGLSVYLFLIPCPNFRPYFAKRNWKRKTSCIPEGNNIDSSGKKLSNILQCSHGCCVGVAVQDLQQKDGSQAERPSVITGPQGHGFYTSGPWKLDTMGPEAFGQFSNPEFLMTEYFASIMSPTTPHEEALDPDVDESQHCHAIGNLTVCTDDDPDDHSNDYALMDVSSHSDADMAMMMF